MEPTRRKPVIAVAKLGITAILASLDAMLKDSGVETKATLTFLTPLSLLTFLKDYEEILKEINDGNQNWCKNLVKKLSGSLVQQLSNITCNNINDNNRKIDYILQSLGQTDSNVYKKILVRGITRCNHVDPENNVTELPCVKHIDCKLSYIIVDEKGYKKEQELPLHVYFVIVPITIATRAGDKLLIFRESGEGDVEYWSQAFEATTIHGLFRAASYVGKHAKDVDKVVLAVDTTHGINSIVAVLARYFHVYALGIHAELMSLKKGENQCMSFPYITLRYNSDPLPLSPQRNQREPRRSETDCDYFEATLYNNMSYYYLYDTIEYLYRELREGIDMVLGLYQVANVKPSQLPAQLLPLYLAKLGMLYWSIASFKHSKALKTEHPVKLKIGFGSGNVIQVKYIVKKSTVLADVLCEAYYNMVRNYLITLYERILSFKAENELSKLCFEGIDYGSSTVTCTNLKELEYLLDPSKTNDRDKQKLYGIFGTPLRALIEPGMRVILLSEINELQKNLSRRIGYMFPRGFAPREQIECKDIKSNEASIKFDDNTQAYCITPASRVNATSDTIRNFIAHAGTARITKNFGIVFDCRCRGIAICISKPLEKLEGNIVEKFWDEVLGGF